MRRRMLLFLVVDIDSLDANTFSAPPGSGASSPSGAHALGTLLFARPHAMPASRLRGLRVWEGRGGCG